MTEFCRIATELSGGDISYKLCGTYSKTQYGYLQS